MRIHTDNTHTHTHTHTYYSVPFVDELNIQYMCGGKLWYIVHNMIR